MFIQSIEISILVLIETNIYFDEGLARTRETLLVTYYGEGGENINPQCEKYVNSTMSGCFDKFDCKCRNAANNTWSCERKLNTNENSIFCHFDDEEGFIEWRDTLVRDMDT